MGHSGGWWRGASKRQIPAALGGRIGGFGCVVFGVRFHSGWIVSLGPVVEELGHIQIRRRAAAKATGFAS